MDVREFLDSHGLTHLAKTLADFRDLQSLQTLASDEDALDALDLISRDAKKLLAAIRTIPSKTLSHGLPTVLALPLLEFEREANPVLALWAMCDFVELTLKLCVMAAAAEHSTLPEPMLRVFYNRIERPTLAAWHDMAQVASDHLLENSVLSKLPSTFAAIHQIIGSDAGSPASSVLSLRNRLAHARPASTEAAQWLKAWRRPLRSLVIDSLSWLREARFIAIEEHGQPCLLRDETGLELEEAYPVPADAAPGSAWLCLGDRALPLGLLAAFDFENRAPMVYMRTQDLGLHYLRIAPTGGVWESDLGSWHAFRDRFLKRQGPPAARTIRSFEEEILRESQRRIGRERELHELTEAVTRLKAGQCLWVGGTAGIGKSNLMAALMQRLLETPPENILVLPYRFRSQDDRNNRATFLTYFLEQLDIWECLRPHASGEEEREPESQTFASPQSSGPVMEVVNSLTRIGPEKRVLLVVDGLDEIVERDARFVDDALLRFLREGVSIVGAGRPELGIPESFRKRNAVEPFPAGLPPMSDTEVRGMLLESLFGAGRRGLLQSEHENGSHGTFVEQVARRSEGLPIYVNYVIGDIFARRIRPENPEELPRGVHAYHEELLRRCAVGDLQALITPMLVMLALAAEALSVEEVAALLRRFGRLETQNLHLVERGLKALGSMLSRTTEPNGKNGLKLYHHSLRTHILQNSNLAETVASVARGLAEASLAPHREEDAAECYLYRHGVRHLLEVHRFKDAVQIQTDFQLLMTRFRKLDESGRAAKDWYADWERLRKAGNFEGDTQVWWDFARANRHCFRAEGWESWRVLFQAAIDHADDSPVTIAAERFLAEGRVNWIWLRYINRPKQWVPIPLVAVLVGHEGPVLGAMELQDQRILSWSSDKTLRIWDPESGECIITLAGLNKTPSEVFQLSTGEIVSWAEFENCLCVWKLGGSEIPSIVFQTRSGWIEGAKLLNDDSIITWSSSYELQIWNPTLGKCMNNFHGHTSYIKGVTELASGTILSWAADETLRVWSKETDECLLLLKGHQASVIGAKELIDNRILSWSSDSTLRVWRADTGACVMVLECDGCYSGLSDAIELLDGRIFCWSDFGTIWIWNLHTGSRERLTLHIDDKSLYPKLGGTIARCNYLRSGTVILSSFDGTHYSCNPKTGECGKPESLPTGVCTDFIELGDQSILSWLCSSTKICLTNLQAKKCAAELTGHSAEIKGAIELKSKYIASFSYDKTIRIWNTLSVFRFKNSNGQLLSTPFKSADESLSFSHPKINQCEKIEDLLLFIDLKDGDINEIKRLKNGHLMLIKKHSVCTACQSNIKRIIVESEHVEGVLGAIELEDERILFWSTDMNLRIIDRITGQCEFLLTGHEGQVKNAYEISGHRLLSIANDKSARIWNIDSGELITVLKNTTFSFGGAIELQNKKILTWDINYFSPPETCLLKLWNPNTGEIEDLEHWHTKQVEGAIQLRDKRIISWSANEAQIWSYSGREFHLKVTAGAIREIMEATSGLIFCWLYSNILLRWDFDAKAQHSWKLPRDWTPKEAKRIRSDLADFPAFLISQLDLQANGQSRSSEHKFDYETALIRGRLLRLQGLD